MMMTNSGNFLTNSYTQQMNISSYAANGFYLQNRPRESNGFQATAQQVLDTPGAVPHVLQSQSHFMMK